MNNTTRDKQEFLEVASRAWDLMQDRPWVNGAITLYISRHSTDHKLTGEIEYIYNYKTNRSALEVSPAKLQDRWDYVSGQLDLNRSHWRWDCK